MVLPLLDLADLRAGERVLDLATEPDARLAWQRAE